MSGVVSMDVIAVPVFCRSEIDIVGQDHSWLVDVEI
jgi:hypothetical protein